MLYDFSNGDYIAEVIRKTSDKVNFIFESKNMIEDGEMKVSGFFDGNKLVVAVNKPFDKWFPIFLHEACHIEQSLLLPDFWEEVDTCYDNFQKWEDKELDVLSEEDKYGVKRIEQDCEQRVLRYIKKFNIPINYNEYLKNAISYVHFYDYYFISKNWYPEVKPPYSSDEIFRFLGNYTNEELFDILNMEKCPDDLLNLFFETYK